VAPITDLLKGNGKDFKFGESQEVALVTITIVFTFGSMPIHRPIDQAIPTLIETNTYDCAVREVLCQKFEDGKIHPCAFL